MKTVKVGTLVLDFDLYPRPSVDGKNVADLVEALSAGVELPPIIVDGKTARVVDGFHRVRAHIRLYGEDAEVSVVERKYDSEADLLADAIRLNAAHGKRLSTLDRVRCVHLGEKYGLSVEQVAEALSVPADSLGRLAVSRTATCGGQNVILKPALRKHAGRRLTKRQRSANEKMNANNARYFADRLIDLIESKLIDEEDEGLAKSLKKLRAALDGVLV